MNIAGWVGVLLLAASGAAGAASKCPSIETSMVDKGFGDGPWRVISGGPGACSFMTANTSVNFGFNHMVSESTDLATKAAVDMHEAIAGNSVVVPTPSLGEHGFAYQTKDDAGAIDPKTMFFYGHRGSVGVSGYLNLASAITPAQRDFAANLIAGTLGVATNAKALARETNCPYLDDALVDKLLPDGERSVIVPDRNNCVMSAGGRVLTVAIVKDARSREAADGMLRSGGCSVDPLPQFGKTAGVMHHCFEGNPRAQVVVAGDGRMLEIAYVPGQGQEPTDAERAMLVDAAAFALKR
ncbi:MAG: hypothetical protein ACTHK2_09040 [Dokdonella sp.]|uniref:hypothetical protein n=1 Tax=Dokdonella sp. TaxID=2291710 RepID=UPI003F7EABE8